MKNTKHTILLMICMACVMSSYAINYPTYHGPSVDRGNDNGQIYVPMQQSPLPKPIIGYHVSSTGAVSFSSQSTSGGALGHTESGSSLKSYGGGGNSVGSASGGSHAANNATVAGGSGSARFSAMPRVKSLADGSRFQSDETPIIASESNMSTLRAGGGPPPPGENEENTDENQLPVGNGIVTLMLCCCGYVAAKRRKNNE